MNEHVDRVVVTRLSLEVLRKLYGRPLLLRFCAVNFFRQGKKNILK